MLYCKYGFIKAGVWVWLGGHAQICGDGCGVMWPAQQVLQAKHIPLHAIIGNFLQFLQKNVGDTLH